MPGKYIPERGDLVWLEFNPQAGRGQAGHRSAVVLSPRGYNRKSSLALLCPHHQPDQRYPFEVQLPENLPVKGVILSDSGEEPGLLRSPSQPGGKTSSQSEG